jgi:hypothetical protein
MLKTIYIYGHYFIPSSKNVKKFFFTQNHKLKIQLNAELAKQKDWLIEKLADQVVERLSQRVSSSGCEISINFTKEELQKLNSF